MELIFFLALLPLLINAIIASNKGKSVGAWIVISLFIGWIATLILAFSEAVKKCDQCRRDIPATAIVCSYCGNKKIT